MFMYIAQVLLLTVYQIYVTMFLLWPHLEALPVTGLFIKNVNINSSVGAFIFFKLFEHKNVNKNL